MKLPVALALVIGVAGAVIAYLYLGPLSGLGLFVPATFLGAATFFAAGGDRPALVTALATNVWGIVTGTVMLVLAGLTTNPALLGLIIGGMTAVFILGALVPVLGFVPGAVVGFATTAAFGLLSGASGTDFSLPTGPFTVMLLSFVVGSVVLGYGCSLVVGRLTARSAAPAAA
ncbi:MULTISPECIES: DUF1097 domain-containing protein [Pseudonocardia]|uniref:DUF1097 domain-containing protein n=1 Tax=Pseudonocardia alni subsp. carboxydivorans TaxID=415010 RepID=A0ABU9A728_PSEA5|nr:DUF1097 domain-containing protein [Pseudonocardia sp. DR1-2]MCM3846758.1 DUF1097 domain-containing protein [Pseudonocardia sp. DR1-2]WFG44696.1 DUF1097 domain-containing protein [Pseudonocardia alni]